jgi:hypothetical protein
MSIESNSQPIQFTGKYQADVVTAAKSLEGADSAHIQVIMEQINNHLKNDPNAQNFMKDVNGQIGSDGKRAQVESVVGQLPAVHDIFSSNGRIKDADLLGKIDLLNGANRFVQAQVAQDMLDDRHSIEKAKHEHKFLFFGNHQGIDDTRLGKFAGQEDEHNKSEKVLTAVGPGTDAFNSLATRPSADGREKYFTKDDLDQAIVNSTGDQHDALVHVREKFRDMSKTIVTGKDYYDNDITTQGITDKSLSKYLQKHGATAETMAAEAQSRDAFQQGLAANGKQADLTPHTEVVDKAAVQTQIETSKQETLAAARKESDTEREIASQLEKAGGHKAVAGDTWVKLALEAQQKDPSWYPGTMEQKVQHLRETNDYDVIMAGKGIYKQGHDLKWKDLLIKGHTYQLFNHEELQRQTKDAIKASRLLTQNDATPYVFDGITDP